MRLLQAEKLTYGIPGGRILQKNLSFSLDDGQVLLVSGANGCGKSTLLKVILGEADALDGNVTCVVAAHRVNYLPQLENTDVHLPLTLEDVLSLSQGHAVNWRDISQFGLLNPEHMAIAWNNASGGERKRTLLTCSLLKKPQLLVFDEPMNHLDDFSRAAVTTAISRYLKASTPAEPRAVVMVCHQGLNEVEARELTVVALPLEPN